MKLLHLEIPGADLDALEHFYHVVLSLPVRRSADGLDVTLGWSMLSFTPAGRPPGHAEHLAFLLPMERFEAAKSWLADRLPLRRDHSGASDFTSSSWGSRSIYFDGPDGNVLELIAYPDWPAVRSGEFEPSELLGLGEFGLAVSDVEATCRTLNGLASDPPAPPDDSFMWVGAAEGRLIVARTGRIWFPDTGVRASPGPFRLTLDGGRTLSDTDLSA